MNLDFLFLLLLTILRCAGGVFCHSHRGGTYIDVTKLTTNAARMRAGYPPLKPRNMDIPSRIHARNPWPSSVPVSPEPYAVTGYIKVNRANDGMMVGYVKKSCSTTTWLGLTHDNDNRMSITFTPANPFNIAINNPPGPYKYLGFAGDSLTGSLSNYMVETNPTSPGSYPSPVGNGLSSTAPNSESAIWSYDSQHRLTAQWIDSDGNSIPSYLWFDPSLGALAIVANAAGQPSSSYQVYCTVVFS